jgi:hypothetical protein
MNARLVSRCELCDGALRSVLDLGSSPPTCVMAPFGQRPATEEHHPLQLLFCNHCAHGQLSVVVNPKVMFPPDYTYQSGNSRALHRDFEELAARANAEVLGGVFPDDLVVDIGANDGTLLSKFTTGRRVAVEPTGQIERFTGGVAYREFFTYELAQRIRAEHGPARVVTACNVLAHVEDVNDVLRGVVHLLADDGVLIAENHDLASVAGGQWDTVYHEHLRFYSPHSFGRALGRHSLSVRSAEPVSTHGGSFRTVADRVTGADLPERDMYDWDALAADAGQARLALRRALSGGGEVWGIGATARATTVINFCGFDVEDLACVCEVAGSDKIGHYVPGTRIPIVDEAVLFAEQPERALLFSWHLSSAIVPKLKAKGYDGEVLVPLPTLYTV